MSVHLEISGLPNGGKEFLSALETIRERYEALRSKHPGVDLEGLMRDHVKRSRAIAKPSADPYKQVAGYFEEFLDRIEKHGPLA